MAIHCRVDAWPPTAGESIAAIVSAAWTIPTTAACVIGERPASRAATYPPAATHRNPYVNVSARAHAFVESASGPGSAVGKSRSRSGSTTASIANDAAVSSTSPATIDSTLRRAEGFICVATIVRATRLAGKCLHGFTCVSAIGRD